jgi:peptide/nickel transport system substrate-binding protein
MSPRILLPLLLISLVLASCGKGSENSEQKSVSAVIAMTGDVDNFNPVVSNVAASQQLNSIVYPMMFDIEFNHSEGSLLHKPALVKSWRFENDGKDVVLVIRDDVRWEDGIPVTIDDIKFSYSLYGDPEVASARSNYVENMIHTNGVFDVDKSITIVDDTTVVFHFTHKYPQQLFHLNLSPIPYHIYKNADRATLRSNPANERPIGAGPFRVERWVRQQEVVLVRNRKSDLPYPAKLESVVARVITEPTTRLTELKKGTVDMLWPIYPEDVDDLQQNYPDIRLETLPPRGYEYIGWANIDFEEYNASNGRNVFPHKLFGDTRVRQALTFGINRKGIMDAKLGEYGEVAVSDVSPIFRWAVNNDLIPYPYDPDKARNLLRQAGWADTDGDGIIDKGGLKFEFTLHYNAGNKRREYACTVAQENLKQLGIKVNILSVDPVVFFENISRKKYDAFLAGFSVPLAIDPSDRWGNISNPFNSSGFRNARVHELINLGMHVGSEREAARFWKEVQAILHQEQPCTFLYWVKDIVGINRRLKNTDVNVLGPLNKMWDWKIGDPKSGATF